MKRYALAPFETHVRNCAMRTECALETLRGLGTTDERSATPHHTGYSNFTLLTHSKHCCNRPYLPNFIACLPDLPPSGSGGRFSSSWRASDSPLLRHSTPSGPSVPRTRSYHGPFTNSRASRRGATAST